MIELTIHQPLRQTLRMAFRSAYRDTFEALVAEVNHHRNPRHSEGFLTALPLISGCAPQIQLELLFDTWQQIDTGTLDQLTSLHHCVIYCAFGSLAMHGETEDRRRLHDAAEAADDQDVNPLWVASTARTFQVIWPLHTDESPVLSECLLGQCQLDRVIERPETDTLLRTTLMRELSRWAADPLMLTNAVSLLSESEMGELGGFLLDHPRLLRR